MPQSQEALLEQCRQAGITFMVLVSDKEGHYLKVNHINTCAGDGNECSDLTGFSSRQVKSFEKDRQSEKRIPESDLLEHFIQKSRTKLSEERNRWRLPPHTRVRVQRKHLMLFFLSLERFRRVLRSRIQRDRYWETQVRGFQAGSRSTFLSCHYFYIRFELFSREAKVI